MSLDVLHWVMKNSDAEKGDRLILYHLAWTANDDGSGCWPSVATMQANSRLKSRSGTQNCLGNLKAAGRIVPVGTHPSGTTNYEVAGPFNPRYTAPEELTDGGPENGQGAQKLDGQGGPISGEGGPIFRGEGAHPSGRGGAHPSGPERSLEKKEKSKEPSDARARVSVTDLDQKIVDELQIVVEAKDAKPLNLEAAARVCEKFGDRAHCLEAEKFRHYFVDGAGENRQLRDVVQTWGNWLRSAPAASTLQHTGRRGNAERVQELMDRAEEQERRQLAEGTPRG